MLINILQKINDPLSKSELSQILYSLIQPHCGYTKKHVVTTISPYDELKPILNEHYTLYFIQTLKEDNYNPTNISSILIHLYQYSFVANRNFVSDLQLQPYVKLNVKENGKFIYTYETYRVHDKLANILFVNDFSFITEPIEYIEKPCYVNVESMRSNIDEMEILYSPEKCDQYLAFQMMLCENNRLNDEQQQKANIPSTSAEAEKQKNNKTTISSRSIFTKHYWVGYYYYGLNHENHYYVN